MREQKHPEIHILAFNIVCTEYRHFCNDSSNVVIKHLWQRHGGMIFYTLTIRNDTETVNGTGNLIIIISYKLKKTEQIKTCIY